MDDKYKKIKTDVAKSNYSKILALADNAITSHEEKIICPECDSIQTGIVEHTIPWHSYVHTCTKCKYIIMESEWNRVETNGNKARK